MSKNEKLFEAISTRDGMLLTLELNTAFQHSLDTFRKATSQIRTLHGLDYPSVYLGANDYGGLTIKFDDKELRLIINLEYYYVYGFLLNDGNVYAYSGEAIDALNELGFKCEIIPYGDAYYDISASLSDEVYASLKQTTVGLKQIKDALTQIADVSISFSNKNESLLIVFWSLVEGIRFAGISNVIKRLIDGESTDFIYDYFFELAEIWSKLSLITAYEKTLNPDIAVYDIKRIH